MTALTENALERSVTIPEVPGGILILSFDDKGVTARLKGTQTKVWISWRDVILNCKTADNVKSYLMGSPMEVLVAANNKVKAKKQ